MSTNESARDKTRSVSIDNERITEDIGWDRISQEIPLHPSIYLHRSSKRQARNIVPANCRSSSIHERINSINKLLLTDRKSIKSGMKSVVYLTRRLPIDVCLARSVPPTTRNESVAKQGGGRRRGRLGGGWNWIPVSWLQMRLHPPSASDFCRALVRARRAPRFSTYRSEPGGGFNFLRASRSFRRLGVRGRRPSASHKYVTTTMKHIFLRWQPTSIDISTPLRGEVIVPFFFYSGHIC